jgi:hypothetical protein
VGDVKIPYYYVTRGRGYWKPNRRMMHEGYNCISLGPDGPLAWTRARELTDLYRARNSPDRGHHDRYPTGSLGEAFVRLKRTPEWDRKAPRTREDWERGWKRIGPIFGDLDPQLVSLDDLSAFRRKVEELVSLSEAHRTLKIWRALWKVAAAFGYCRRDADPSLGVRNSAPPPRQGVWREGEVVRIVKTAWRAGYRGLAALIAIAWDTQLSPVDCRKLTLSQRAADSRGTVFYIDRAKTGRAAAGTLSRRSEALLEAYLAGLGYNLHDDAPIFRTRGHGQGDGRPWPARPYTKDRLSEDFRTARTATFGEGDKRQLADLRRSGAVEAFAGRAEPGLVASKMANTLSASNRLHRTYVPVDAASVRQVDDARRLGRAAIRETEGRTKVEKQRAKDVEN